MITGEVKRAYQREWLQQRRRAWAVGKICYFCGDPIDPDHYHVHHLDPSQKISHRIWSWSKERLEEELTKCRPACPDCHRQYTTAEQIKPLEHGTVHGYKRRGCRCSACRAAWAAYMKDYFTRRNKSMIDYQKVKRGDILKIVGVGAPGFANLGDLVRVTEVHVNSVNVEDRNGKTAEFMFNCGAARLEGTEWKEDFPNDAANQG